MEREQAIQINDQLVIAHEAMKKARIAIAELGNRSGLNWMARFMTSCSSWNGR